MVQPPFNARLYVPKNTYRSIKYVVDTNVPRSIMDLHSCLFLFNKMLTETSLTNTLALVKNYLNECYITNYN